MTRLIAVALLLGSLLPLAQWIPGGETDPLFTARLNDWALGFALCAVLGVLTWFLSRSAVLSAPAASWPLDAPGERRGAALLSTVALAVYVWAAREVFSSQPLLIDEMVQVLQARDLSQFQLSHAIPGPSVFFSILNEVDFGGQAYGQYPVGGPAMLVLGVWLGAPWLVGPLVGAACVWLFWLLLRDVEETGSPQWRLGATALFALSPFAVFMFGSHMNHATVLLWVLAACVSLSRALRPGAALGWGLSTGLALGLAATIRPLDAVAFALPAAGWLMWRSRTGGRPLAMLALTGIGAALPVVLLFLANEATTGHPLKFGYDVLWGSTHGLGFHSTPWGDVHTPARGVELTSVYLNRLNTFLFELPFPSLLLPIAGLWYWRARLSVLDRFLLCAAGLVALGYWAYWHDGFFRGPRFLFVWLPLLVLWSARGLHAVWESYASNVPVARGLRVGLFAAAAYALVTIFTVRAPTYRNSHSSVRIDTEAAARAGIQNALVLVQESWGSQLVARLWAIGVGRPESEALYRTVDACVLEESLSSMEQRAVRGDDAFQALRRLTRDSARLVPNDLSPDNTARRLPGLTYTARCLSRLEADRAGYLLYAPWRLVDDGNVYARWLPEREQEISALFPGRVVYRLRRDGSSVDAGLVWEALDSTSLSR